jgi:hypothetical protein
MANVIYRFVADGAPAVVRAFGDIEAAAAKARKGTRATVKADGAAAKSGERTATTRTSAAQRGATAEEKAAQASVRAAEKAAAAKARIEERNQRYVARLKDRYFAEEQRKEERAQRAMIRRQEQLAAKRTAEVAKRSDAFKGQLAGAALGFGATVVAGGVAVTGAAARQALTNQEKAAALSRNSRGAGEDAVDPTTLRKEAEAVARATPGIKVGDLLDASAQFVSKTGDLESARAMQQTMATVASATGADVMDISSVAAELREKFQITGDADMKQALATLTMQGKAGAFELKDAAGQYSKLGAAAAGFGVDKGVAGITKLGGLTQIARSATGSPEQAATALEATFRQLVVSAEKLKAEGADVYAADGSKRDITDIIVDAVSKVGGTNLQEKDKKLQDIFGEQGIRALRPLITTFNDEVKRGGDGVAALRSKLDEAMNVPGAWADVQQDAAAAQSQASAKMVGAWENLTAKVGDQVLPVIARFVESLSENEGAIDAFAGVLEVAVDALTALVDFLASIPGIGSAFKRDASPEKERERAAKELARVDGMIEGRGGALALDVADPLAQKKIALESKIAGIDEKLARGPTIQGGPLSDEAFGAAITEAGPSGAERRSAALDTLKNPFTMMLPIAGMAGAANKLFGDTDEQASIRARQDSAAAAAEIQKQAAAAADLKDAAASLKEAAAAQKSASIFNVLGL